MLARRYHVFLTFSQTLLLLPLLLLAPGCAPQPENGPATARQANATAPDRKSPQARLTAKYLSGMGAGIGREYQTLQWGACYLLGSSLQLPAEFEQILPLLPFARLGSDWALTRGEGPNSEVVLMLERTDQSGGNETTEMLESFQPKLGRDAGIERYALLILPEQTPGSLSEVEQAMYFQLAGFLAPHFGEFGTEADEAGLFHRTPAPGAGSCYMGYMAATVGNLMVDAAADRSVPRVATLSELAAQFGGQRESAWKNPYTGQAMQNVPLDQPTAGDYTELADPEGLLLVFHYQDETGGVSSRVAGVRGEGTPGGMTALLEEAQGLPPTTQLH